MEAKDFIGTFPGKLVSLDAGGIAFVPTPLPRAMGLEAKTVQRLAVAENALGRLEGSVGRLVSPYLVARPLLRREAILSSRIEGTYTTPQQLVLLEAVDEDATPRARARAENAETREVLNYMRAMNHGLRRIQQIPVCLRLIKELHDVLLRGVRGDGEQPGEFRAVQNYIGRQGDSLRNARFVPPPVASLQECLGDLEAFINPPERGDDTELPLLVRLALIHYQFETIHPFRDGNGRVGRLLIPLILCSEERMASPTLFVSAYFEQHREAYVDLMLRVSQRGDWTAWINFFLTAVGESARESLARVDRLLALRDRYRARFQRARSSALLLKLIDALFEQPSTTIPIAKAMLDVTYAAAAANIQKLVAAEILREATGRQRDRMFIADEILSTVFDEPPRESNQTNGDRTIVRTRSR